MQNLSWMCKKICKTSSQHDFLLAFNVCFLLFHFFNLHVGTMDSKNLLRVYTFWLEAKERKYKFLEGIT